MLLSGGVRIYSPDGVLEISREQFEHAAGDHFSPHVLVMSSGGPHSDDVTAVVRRPGEQWFSIVHARDGKSISTDGDVEQCAEVALWVRSLLPDMPAGRIWMADAGFSGHVDLRPGMSPADTKSQWVSHEEHQPADQLDAR